MSVSLDTLEFLDAFKQPIRPLSLCKKFDIQNVESVLNSMVKSNFLLMFDRDEEVDYLKQHDLLKDKSEFTTQYCRCFYPENDKTHAEKFTHYIQERYLSAPKVFQELRSKLIIYLGKNQKDTASFWPKPLSSCNSSIHNVSFDRSKKIYMGSHGFVALNRILVMDMEKLKVINWETPDFKNSMLHEVMHILLHEQKIILPLWLEEGTCDYFSKPVQINRLLSLTKKKPLFSFKELEEKATHTLLDIDRNKAINNICYQQAHHFVVFLCKKYSESRYIECILKTGLNYPFREVFADMFASSLEMEEIQWRNHLKRFGESKNDSELI